MRLRLIRIYIPVSYTHLDVYKRQNNDSFTIKDGRIVKKTNHSGGVLGGMSDGSDIIIRAAVKPTPSIARTQETVNKSGEDIEISIKGRHDPMIVPRAVVVVEAMTAVTLVAVSYTHLDVYKRQCVRW